MNLFDSLPNPLLAPTFAVLDFETTGLYPAVGDEIVEIGVVRVEKGKLTREYSQLVNPGRDMDPAAIQVSGITPDILTSEPPFENIVDVFLDHLKDYVIVAHNCEFDMAFLQSKLMRLGRPQLENQVLDTLELARSREDAGANTLGTLANRLGIEGNHAHRALDDAKMAAKVLVYFLEEFNRRGTTDLSRLPGYRKSYTFSFEEKGGEVGHFKRVVDLIRAAINTDGALNIVYRGAAKKTERIVSPRAIRGMSVRAFCHLRQEEKDFRLDRIVEATPAVPPQKTGA